MIPATALGLFLFSVVLGPGYAWVRYAEKRSARPKRSGVLEAADVIFVGLLATSLSLVILFLFAPVVDFPSLREIIRDRDSFVTDHPYQAVAGTAFVVILATTGSLLAAWFVHRGRAKAIHPGSTVWHDVFAVSAEGRDIAVSVEIDDGRILEGLFFSHLLDAEENDVDLALKGPLHVWERSSTSDGRRRSRVPGDRVIVPSSRIVAVWAQYLARD